MRILTDRRTLRSLHFKEPDLPKHGQRDEDPPMRIDALLAATALFLMLSGCLVTPVEKSGGIGSITVSNSNPGAILAAAQDIFPMYGYQLHRVNALSSVSFDKSSSRIANVMWGSYGDPQTLRVKVMIVPIPGTDDYRVSPKVFTIGNAGEAGFEDKRPLMSLWSGEFAPLLQKVAAQAGGAGRL